MTKFIEIVKLGEIEPIMINTDHIVRIEPYERGCRLVMTGNFPDIFTSQGYVYLFEELQ